MSKSLKAASLKFATLAAGLACAAQAMAVDLTVVSFGGANKSAQIKAFYEPYQKATGNRIVAGEYNGEMAKVKAMVDTNSVSSGPGGSGVAGAVARLRRRPVRGTRPGAVR